MVLATSHLPYIKAVREVVQLIRDAELYLTSSLFLILLTFAVETLLNHCHSFIYTDLMKVIKTTTKDLLTLSYKD
jgi:hypothetical protein